MDRIFQKKKEFVYNSENELSEDQLRALKLFYYGKNLFIMGAGGVGKSFLIKEMKKLNEETGKTLVVTATTGIASYNINGITIHSFMGIGTGENEINDLIFKISRKKAVLTRLKLLDILVIDEISMMSAELFEKINTIFQTVRKSKELFGGVQVVLSGDLKQLLPVFNRNEIIYSEQDTRLIFESKVFNKFFNTGNIILLNKNFRQNDSIFIDLLLRIRDSEHTKEDLELLNTRKVEKIQSIDLNSMIYLVSTNKKAQAINSKNLDNLKDKLRIYNSKFQEEGNPEISMELSRELKSQFKQKGIDTLQLKEKARVMLIKNISVELGLVNGSTGTIEKFISINGMEYPLVKFDNGVEHIIELEEWDLEFNKSKAKGIQLPLMLSWALTSHKAQSLTIEKAVMSLGDCFCEHQVYTALSRMKTLEGLYLSSFNPSKITINKKVKEFCNSLKK